MTTDSISKLTVPHHSSVSWSIQPIVIWLRILGIDFPDVNSRNTSRLKRWALYLYGTLCFLCHLLCQIDILYFLHAHRAQASSDLFGDVNTVTSSWNVTIDFTNYAIFSIGSHLFMLTFIKKRWHLMIQSIQRWHFAFDDHLYVKIRRMSFFGVGYIIFLVRIN